MFCIVERASINLEWRSRVARLSILVARDIDIRRHQRSRLNVAANVKQVSSCHSERTALTSARARFAPRRVARRQAYPAFRSATTDDDDVRAASTFLLHRAVIWVDRRGKKVRIATGRKSTARVAIHINLHDERS